MAASYPTSVVSFTTKYTGQTIEASDINNPQAEIVAIESDLLAGLPPARGGTGNTTYTTGDLLAASSASAIGKLAAVASGQVLASAGASAVPAYTANPAVSSVVLNGSTSGTTTVKPANVAGTGIITLPVGTTDFSATGGASQVVKQTTSGGAFTVAQLAASDMSNGTTGAGAIVLAASPTLTGTLTLASVSLTGGTRVDVTTTGTINDLSLSTAFRSAMNVVLRMNNASDATINGIAGGVDGSLLTIQAIGAGKVYLAHQNAGSTAGNRMLNVLTSGNTPLAAGGSAVYVYDNASGRWRLIQHEQGNFITYTPSLTNLTQGNGTLSARYYVRGLDVRVDIALAFGSTSTYGAGSAFTFSVPYTASGLSNLHPTVASGYHAATGLSAGVWSLANAATTFTISRTTEIESSVGWNNSTPWVWANGDTISLSGIYTTS